MIFFLFDFQKVNFRKVMTGTVWDPVITGTPMTLHDQVLLVLERKCVCGL